MENDGSNDYIINDAYENPFHEMLEPRLACQYPMSGAIASETVNGNLNGSYGVLAPTFTAGPAIASDAKYGRGGGWANPDSLTATTSKVASMSGPIPSGSNQNPAGITGFPFTMSCWFRHTDTTVDIDPSGDSDSDGTLCTIIGVQNHNALYGASGMFARIQIRRRQTNSSLYRPGIWMRASISDGTTEVYEETDPTNSPWEAAMQDTLWHYVYMVVTGSHIQLYLDGVKIASKAHSVSFPTTPRFRLGVNTDWQSSLSHRAMQFSHASVYATSFSRTDGERHFNAMRHPLDMKVNYNASRYSTNLITKIGGTSTKTDAEQIEDDLGYSRSAKKAVHRHDGRWTNVIRINEPFFNSADGDNDDGESDHKICLPRHYSLAGTPPDANQRFRYNTHTATGGCFATTTNGEGVTMIAGWEGMFGPRTGSYSPAKFDYTCIIDWTGTGNTGGAGINRSWTYGTGAGGLAGGEGTSTTAEGSDGRDGFALSRISTAGASGTNRFAFYIPWETTASGGNTYLQQVESSSGSAKDWEYQSIGACADQSGLMLAVYNQPCLTESNHVTSLEPSNYQSQPDPAVAVTRINRNQCERVPRMLYCNRDTTNGNPPSDGNSEATDKGLYGPIAIFAQKIPDLAMQRILRVMHGQPQIRSRPSLRSPMRHFVCNGPTRSTK